MGIALVGRRWGRALGRLVVVVSGKSEFPIEYKGQWARNSPMISPVRREYKYL